MAATKLKVVRKPPARSEVREKLADAIAEHAAATRGVSNARAALERARVFRSEAGASLEKAKINVEKAKSKAVARAASKASSTAPPADAMRLARQAEADAVDALDVAHKAIRECEERLAQAEKDLRWAEPQLTNAVDRVLAAELGARILKETAELQESLSCKTIAAS